MMAMISPAYYSVMESLSSLKFAHRAKSIRNVARVNEDVDQRALLRKYETELRQLRLELSEKNKNVMNKESLYKLEHEKRKAEEDKAAAISALEELSKEVDKEKDERKRLEDKIRVMSSQMLLGGKKIEDTPQFLFALEEKQKAIKQEYDKKLQDLEREREQIEEDRAEVDQYKQLLLKQRDIMVALTTRLNERDETIIQLQEEIDAYDRIHKESVDALEKSYARVQLLEGMMESNKLQVPPPDEEEKLIERTDIIQRRYAPYQVENGVEPQDTEATEAPLYLLTAEEKVMELMDVIDHQKTLLGSYRNSSLEAQLKERTKELERKDAEIAKLRKELETSKPSNEKQIVESVDGDMLAIVSNALKELKEQKDQYRLYHIIQNVTTLQKMLLNSSNKPG
eukprot:TRINITY_DN9339_c0_g3_i1.p1 TRINITY_DN9339_c0_g3~~TRINITY_DN9339_c0_g3_i1.p1  ORF type:complete len:398 (+),score=161.10 TRINITY_DN9339_c0_g3_i1:215-1408(+)